ncbi:MAG: hypothetical protein IJ711_12970, partial [Lachnospiraceae bacterium]|nr:hypothetical protein [Lachnospiraceae bacterium]
MHKRTKLFLSRFTSVFLSAALIGTSAPVSNTVYAAQPASVSFSEETDGESNAVSQNEMTPAFSEETVGVTEPASAADEATSESAPLTESDPEFLPDAGSDNGSEDYDAFNLAVQSLFEKDGHPLLTVDREYY